MAAEHQFPFTQEPDDEMRRVRALADSLGIRFDEIVRAGSQGTTIGIQAKSVLFSLRADSRTAFVQDVRFGQHAPLGVLDAPEEEYLRIAHEILEKLEIPRTEIAAAALQQELTQTAERRPVAPRRVSSRWRRASGT